MKRTIGIALLVGAMVFGVIAMANAAAPPVVVTAGVNSVLTIAVDTNAVAFGNVDPGASYVNATTPQVTVKSNKDFTYTEAAATGDAAIITYMTQGGVVNQGIEGSRGVFKKTYTYTLDLTPDTAFTDLDPAMSYTANYNFTAVQL